MSGWLGRTNMYTSSLEARVWTSNKEQVYGLVRPNLFGSTWKHQLMSLGKLPIILEEEYVEYTSC
jgi:hypothetical protein